MLKFLSYLQNHKYGMALGLIFTVLAIVLGFIFWLFPQSPRTDDNITSLTNEENNKINNDGGGEEKDDGNNENSKVFYGSVFDSAQQVSLENITLKKENLVESKYGLCLTPKFRQ